MSKFTQREIERAIRGASKSGLSIARVEIAPGSGTIAIIAVGAETPPDDTWDAELAAWRKANAEN